MSRKNLTQTDFARIHQLIGMKVKPSIVAKIVGKSQGTIYLVRQFESMPDYLAEIKRRHDAMVGRKQALITKPVVILPQPITNKVTPTMSKIDEIHLMVKKLLDLMTP